MKTHTRLVSLITLVALIGFMLAAVSCKSTVASAQKQFDQVSAKYEAASGISTQQTVSLVGKWWQDYQKAKELKDLLNTDIIQATKASPVTSTKDVIENVNPQASASPRSRVRQDVDDPVSPPLAPAPKDTPKVSPSKTEAPEQLLTSNT